MLARFKDQLLSSNGMTIVNVFFALSAFFLGPFSTIIAFSLWLAFLVYNILHTPHKSTQIVYGLLACYALFVLLYNIYALLTLLH